MLCARRVHRNGPEWMHCLRPHAIRMRNPSAHIALMYYIHTCSLAIDGQWITQYCDNYTVMPQPFCRCGTVSTQQPPAYRFDYPFAFRMQLIGYSVRPAIPYARTGVLMAPAEVCCTKSPTIRSIPMCPCVLTLVGTHGVSIGRTAHRCQRRRPL